MVKEKKSQLHMNFHRMLAVAAPSNGKEFIKVIESILNFGSE